MKPEKAARKRRLPWRRILLLPAVLLLAVAAYFIESRSGWSDLYRAAGVSLDAPDADLLAQTSTTVTVLDVGQGDAVLIGQDGAYCLIDTGPSDAKGDLVRDLQLAGISKLDYLVLTHPHADHTGGAREVLRNLLSGNYLYHPGMPRPAARLPIGRADCLIWPLSRGPTLSPPRTALSTRWAAAP